MKKLKKIMKVLVAVLAAITIIFGILALLPSRTPQIKMDGKVVPNSIAELRKVEIGGIDQTLLIRGHNKNNPVILFLHGGPGQGEVGFMRGYQKALEEKFVVVRWDQRGAGASYSKDVPKESFTIEQLLKDTDEVTDYLREQFNQPQIFISGHSWGTVLGTLAAKSHPEKYLAYISVGQVVNMKENEKLSYQFAWTKAREANDEEAIKQLEQIELTYTSDNMMSYRKYVDKFGGVIQTKPEKGIASSLLLSPEYRLSEKQNFQKRTLDVGRLMIPEIMNINFMEEVKGLEVPTYFIIGKHDYTSVYPLVEEFYEQLEAPVKELIVFDNSAHLPQLEENKKFNDTVIRIMEEVTGRGN
ncbi:alpha/beta hydrolase [Paenibacillus sp. J5C_2022]|uniref:alpha/beta fold hydrolase n=1 Tax=Paenibacillus sp. J5C2022 TaxID=2977129 RepID=UPI0021D061B7|nr:alpha/beta hydrolase [Paenibacillus sp. J5C2022]MCU6710493.1 alpha/beta hydrolase [Paenibacillus sp. J5C2022]